MILMPHYLEKEFYTLLRDRDIFNALEHSSLDGLWYWDLENPQNMWLNKTFWQILGYDPDQKKHLASEWQNVVYPDDLNKVKQELAKHLADPSYKYSAIVRYKHRNGSIVWIKCSGIAIRDENGKPLRVLGTRSDISDLKQIELKLKETQDFLELMFDASEDIIFVKDKNYCLVRANRAFFNLFPKNTHSSLIGSTLIENFNSSDAEYFLKYDALAFETGSSKTIEYIKLPNGEDRILDTYKIRFYDKNNTPYLLGIARDVTEREIILNKLKDTNKKLEEIAYKDDLTGLLNRKGFIKKASNHIAEIQNLNLVTLFCIDLDNFKFINDSFGYNIGDGLIIKISKRLKNFFNKDTIIGRSGGDDFLILTDNLQSLIEIAQIAENLIKEIAKPYIMKGNTFSQSSSIGIAIYPNVADNFEKLIQFADTAMHHAKAKGKNTYSFYSLDYDQKTQRRNSIDRELRNAEMAEFTIVYQPQFDINNEIYGVEALVRWQSPKLGNISPEEFMPIAEKNQTIKNIGKWIFIRTIQDWNKLLSLNLANNLKLSINVSSVQILQENFCSEVINIISNIDKHSITLEITETHLLANIDLTRTVISNMNKLGISFALDDFGTGYSSLKYLANLPIDYLKIDKEFVQNLNIQNNKEIIIAITQLAKNLNKYCIAEGIETLEQFNFLKSIGCNFYQGYYFSKPISFLVLKKLLQSK
ncbi:EAL domain-containing protein [Francisella tularensis subsp. novicida]|nr:signal transduction protein with a PAS [Francisella tularensis subsp. novicida GA99-3549]MBK2344033.1 EAL domain-containing protein [Francisella tularensis subsp. novicida]MBK2349375.1 EAL domain-containing protein [Francisella tularensis subsp. novicida]MBK2352935.1 EAL domain-containing protein [Francisella tularensis subsp. novicida]MBK2354730.1 EAL domain-containing protein [Francisella tularensis subsp. novicida]